MINLEISDWLYNAGLVGFYNILNEYYDSKVELDELVSLKGNSISFDESVLENFGDKYFGYFIKNFSNMTSYGKILNYKTDFIRYKNNIDAFSEKDLKELNDKIEYMKDKLIRKSFLSCYEMVDNGQTINIEIKKIKKIAIKKSEKIIDIQLSILEQLNLLINLIDLISEEEIKTHLLTKEFVYTFTSSFLGNVANWYRKKDSQDEIKTYNIYFLSKISSFMESDTKNFKNNCTSCNILLNSNFSFDLTWLNDTGVDGAKKSAHFWNFNPDINICPICNLIYSCIPAGFTFLNMKGFFVNANTTIKTLINSNKNNENSYLDSSMDISALEMKSYFQIAKAYENLGVEKLNKEIENIQIVKIDSSNKRIYTFNQLNKKSAYIIFLSKKELEAVLNTKIKLSDKEYLNIYDEIIRRIFNNQNMYDILSNCISYKLQGKTSIFSAEKIMKIQSNILKIKFKTEGEVMEKSIEHCKFCGRDLKAKYEIQKKENKINTITYRALNALKTKNASKFLDIVINAYMTIGEQVPNVFINTLKNEDMLLAYGFAFVLGMQSGDVKDTKKDEENKTN